MIFCFCRRLFRGGLCLVCFKLRPDRGAGLPYLPVPVSYTHLDVYKRQPYDRLQAAGNVVDKANYELVYSAPLAPETSLEDIYTLSLIHIYLLLGGA